MSDRNRLCGMVGRCIFLPLLLLLSACWGGKKESPADEAKAVLVEALSALQVGNVDGYVQHVDFGGDMDSLQHSVLSALLRQHLDQRTQQRGALTGIEALDGKMRGDTVCTVFYQLTFADSTVEVASQKMVKVGSVWKIRVRN
ncbi:MAG: hypothetical protein IJV06_09275 [Bacteroidaceae bacterium]|nr:hypothetical protein [Bacteroidaceae bacterium]